MTYQAVMPRDIESARHIGRWRMRPDAALCTLALLGSVSVGACLMRAPAWLSASTVPAPTSTAASAQPRHAAATVAPTAKAGGPVGTALTPMSPLRRLAKLAPPTQVAVAAPPKAAETAPALSASVAAAVPLVVAETAPVVPAPMVPAPVIATQAAPVADPATPVTKAAPIVAEAAPFRPSLEASVGDAVEPDSDASIPAATALEHEIPMPVRRPARLAALEAPPPSTLAMPRRVAAAREGAPPAQVAAPAAQPGAAQADGNSFFDKLFKPQPQQAAPALAYAAPESQGGGLFSWLNGPRARAVAPDRQTAIYDISAHTVTLPDGTRLEAHSGYAEAKDDPSSVAVHMRGVTPPNMYDLKPREALFHGVRALRMTPIGTGATYGRAGLLTHSYMLRGREGESNGCVVFRDYEAFLRAYDAGEVRRLLVVSRAS